MNPPSIPPPPPPPPPLNIPPSRARLQLAARLAMNKRNAAAAAANGSQESSSSAAETSGISSFSLPTTSNDRLRNPFADDEDDDEGSGSGSDDGELDNLGNEGGSSGWNRGSWWRGVVRSARRSNRRSIDKDTGREERFGDGRDDSDDSDGPDDDADDIEDEEFGDFAMPEATPAPTSMVSGIDPAREKILLKPLPVHPSAVKTSSFGSLWPFNTQSFGSKGIDRKDDIDLDKTPTQEKAPELPLKPDDGAEVVGEDGKKIDRAVEAKSRTSIEDPDEDDVVVGEEIIVGRAGTR